MLDSNDHAQGLDSKKRKKEVLIDLPWLRGDGARPTWPLFAPSAST